MSNLFHKVPSPLAPLPFKKRARGNTLVSQEYGVMALRTTEVIFIRFLFIFLIIFSITPLWALESDSVRLSDLSSQKIVEHIIYESFLEKNHKAEEMIGYQIDYYFHPQWYFGIAVHGVIQGRNSGGFGIAGFGLGYHYTIFNVEGDTKLLIGSGGAGV